MKLKMPKHSQHLAAPLLGAVSECCERFDRRLPVLRTALLCAGLLAAAFQIRTAADYLFGTGLLLHWAIWFQTWWRSPGRGG